MDSRYVKFSHYDGTTNRDINKKINTTQQNTQNKTLQWFCKIHVVFRVVLKWGFEVGKRVNENVRTHVCVWYCGGGVFLTLHY